MIIISFLIILFKEFRFWTSKQDIFNCHNTATKTPLKPTLTLFKDIKDPPSKPVKLSSGWFWSLSTTGEQNERDARCSTSGISGILPGIRLQWVWGLVSVLLRLIPILIVLV